MLRKSLLAVVVSVSVLSIGPVRAEQVASHEGAVVNAVEVEAELSTLSPTLQAAVRQSDTSAQNLVSDLVARRVIAERAREEGLESDPLVEARIRLARERALYEVYLERATAKIIDPVVVERLARNEYQAFPEKYRAGEEVRVRHVLIRSCECAPDKAREQAEAVLARLKAGESFETVAEKESADTGSAQKGGDLGFIPRGRTVAPFEQAAFALKTPGDLSDLVETQFGFHIIRLEERKAPRVVPFDEVKDALMESIAAKLKAAERVRIVGPIREPGAISIDADALRKAVAADH